MTQNIQHKICFNINILWLPIREISRMNICVKFDIFDNPMMKGYIFSDGSNKRFIIWEPKKLLLLLGNVKSWIN